MFIVYNKSLKDRFIIVLQTTSLSGFIFFKVSNLDPVFLSKTLKKKAKKMEI